MSLFSKLTGGASEPKGDERRQHTRHDSAGERLVMLAADGKDTQHVYDIVDISEGGLCFGGYDGSMKGGQYFEFRLLGVAERGGGEASGFANVVRVFNGKVACKFPPQPRLKKFLRAYLP